MSGLLIQRIMLAGSTLSTPLRAQGINRSLPPRAFSLSLLVFMLTTQSFAGQTVLLCTSEGPAYRSGHIANQVQPGQLYHARKHPQNDKWCELLIDGVVHQAELRFFTFAEKHQQELHQKFSIIRSPALFRQAVNNYIEFSRKLNVFRKTYTLEYQAQLAAFAERMEARAAEYERLAKMDELKQSIEAAEARAAAAEQAARQAEWQASQAESAARAAEAAAHNAQDSMFHNQHNSYW